MSGEAIGFGVLLYVGFKLVMRCLSRGLNNASNSQEWKNAPRAHETIEGYYQRMDGFTTLQDLSNKEGHGNDN